MISNRRKAQIEEEHHQDETDSDSSIHNDEDIQYHRSELKDFDPQMLSPPKPLAFKDKVRKRIKAGIVNIILFLWEMVLSIVSIAMLGVYFQACNNCDQPIWSWLLVNTCMAFLCTSVVLFLKGKKMVVIAILYSFLRSGWSIYGIVVVARETSCVAKHANGAHIFSIISIISNVIQVVVITLIGSFLVGLYVAKLVQRDKKKEKRQYSKLDDLNSYVNQSVLFTEVDSHESEIQENYSQFEANNESIMVEKPLPTNDCSFPVDEVILEDEVNPEDIDVEHLDMDPIDEIKLKFNL
ncbi:hypothetical protein C9374_007157 [Naegleria lovaniensis]|uniref:Uncharacterized protein n=1 Tax=Naegleria lovaniensis TaxID=51637 RepID=A0AA88H6S2_NAELO|nr:uncharacterized protein C9374_007157 [Naegleria lovaniensis]KAG2393626.1 hypothetical protein C9374_007157 [Naegleria lovaniensis]